MSFHKSSGNVNVTADINKSFFFAKSLLKNTKTAMSKQSINQQRQKKETNS